MRDLGAAIASHDVLSECFESLATGLAHRDRDRPGLADFHLFHRSRFPSVRSTNDIALVAVLDS